MSSKYDEQIRKALLGSADYLRARCPDCGFKVLAVKRDGTFIAVESCDCVDGDRETRDA